jgi:N-methylhydantoinase A/oxoprolinase/acetone carboxylase beta subunit
VAGFERPTTVIALAVVLLAAGCGSADREADVAAVTDRFHAALEADDGSGACAELGSETIKKLEQQERRPCEQAILELDLPSRARAASADVYITSAYADLGEAGADFLDEGPDGWKISAAGCMPSEPDQPYDCELEG